MKFVSEKPATYSKIVGRSNTAKTSTVFHLLATEFAGKRGILITPEYNTNMIDHKCAQFGVPNDTELVICDNYCLTLPEYKDIIRAIKYRLEHEYFQKSENPIEFILIDDINLLARNFNVICAYNELNKLELELRKIAVQYNVRVVATQNAGVGVTNSDYAVILTKDNNGVFSCTTTKCRYQDERTPNFDFSIAATRFLGDPTNMDYIQFVPESVVEEDSIENVEFTNSEEMVEYFMDKLAKAFQK